MPKLPAPVKSGALPPLDKNKLYRERGKKRAIVGKEDQDDIFLADLDSSAEKIIQHSQRANRAESEGASPLYQRLTFDNADAIRSVSSPCLMTNQTHTAS